MKRQCKTHGLTEHGAQNRCLLCKKSHSSRYRSGVRSRKIPGHKSTVSTAAQKTCERPSCTKPAVMWKKDPRWCGHTDRVWCLYRHNRSKKKAKASA